MRNNIFYSVFFGILLYISVSGRAQSLRGEFNMSAYPEISFVWNEYNPEIKDSTQFLLTEDGKKIPFQLQHLPYSDTVKRNKTILFLWEDLDHPLHKGQSEFTQQFLYQFLQQTSVREGDRFNVAVFDRKGGNDFGSSIHTLFSDSFTSNKELLAQAVQNFSHKYDFFSKQVSSELYMAIEEGINLLSKEPADRVRALVVITAGSNQDKHGGKGDFADVKAVELKIPIYLVKYPVPHCEHCTNIDGISARTFGKQIETADTEIAINLLKECFNKMNEQHYGQDYRVSFLTEYPQDGNQHLISWNVNGKEYPLTYIAPSFSFVDWLKEHTLLAILTTMGALLLLATAVFFIVRAIRKKKRKKVIEEEKVRIEIEEKQKKADDEINRLKRNIEEKEKNAEEQRKNEYEKDLLNIMQTKNFFPRLQYIINGANMSFTIRQPFTTIGRSKDNHLIIPAESVSRKHAQIIFTGNGFEIQDLGSANKVIVNGRPVQRTTLNNGDTVKLGEIILYFYN
ncbi:MAG: FHA domain-containing protein [Bacteroidales bacterium]|jgi:hypothetical protein|nr:FHA domain-containing protein [Bacteroidales bacterium]